GPADRPGHLPERPDRSGDGGPEGRPRRPRLRRRPDGAAGEGQGDTGHADRGARGAKPVMRPIPERPTGDGKGDLAAGQRDRPRPGDVRRDATTLTSGLIVGNLYEQSKIFDVVVWGAPGARSNLTELGNLPIDTPSGGQVALKDVATVAVHAEPDAIVHDDVL